MIKALTLLTAIFLIGCYTGEDLDAKEYKINQVMVEMITFHKAHGRCWAVTHDIRDTVSGLTLVPNEMCEENELGAVPR